MGLSTAPERGYDLSTVAADIHQLVHEMGYRDVKIVGHDWGGAVGAFCALRYRHEVTKLVFIESALAGCGFENLWNFATPNPALSFIPFLLMGGANAEADVTTNFVERKRAHVPSIPVADLHR
jgi:pimeloyl-ACP methyl ester carboxylesterase